MRFWNLAVVTFLMIIASIANGQVVEKDLGLLRAHSTSERERKTKEHSPNLYRKIIQPQLSTSCVYENECREFRRGLFGEYGILKATFLTIDRWGRCTHISTMESLPVRLNKQGKIIESPLDYRLH